MATYGFATGSNLTDLGRNLVAQESSRNALQAALAAAAAQQGVARTQAGASRYSTDSQSQGNQLTALMRVLENQRLTAATEAERGLRDRELTLKDLISKLQFAGNTPEEMGKARVHDIALANIAAEAQKAVNQRPHYQIERERLEQEQEDRAFNSLIEPGLARANAASDKLYQEIVGNRGWENNIFGLGTNAAEAANLYSQRARAEIPPTLGELGPYVIPEVIDGRVRFTVKRRGQSALPLPPPPLSVDEVESALGGSTAPAVPLMRAPTVPRGTNDVPTLPMLPVTPDAEPGFFSRLGQGAIKAATGPTALIGELLGRLSHTMAPAKTQGFSEPVDAYTNTVPEIRAKYEASRALSPNEVLRQIGPGAPFQELVPVVLGPSYAWETRPEKVTEGISRYIENLLGEAKRTEGPRRDAILQELSRIRQLAGRLN